MKSISSMFILSFLCLPRPLIADTLRGTVQDEQGKPIPAARVDIATAAPKIGRGMFCPSCYADCKKSAQTNEHGEFVIESDDPKRKRRVLLMVPGKQTRITALIDPVNETAKLVLPDNLEDFPA